MSVEQDFLPFATGGSANVLSQSAYASLGALATGFQSGVANSAQLNKVWRQSSIMSAVLAQFIVQQTGQPAIDDGTTATLLANLVAAVKAASNSVVGQSRNLVMNVSAASATATLTADEIIVESALGGNTYKVASFSKTINLATTGAGGMDAGAAPASGYVALYAIYNPTSGASALLATNATSSKQTNVYGGGNMPAGYTASALVAVVPTNSSGQFVVSRIQDRHVDLVPTSLLSTGAQATVLTSLSISSAVPLNATSVDVNVGMQSSSGGVPMTSTVAGTSTGVGQGIALAGSVAGLSFSSTIRRVPIVAAQTIYYTWVCASGTLVFTMQASGYDF